MSTADPPSLAPSTAETGMWRGVLAALRGLGLALILAMLDHFIVRPARY
jgi:hypothetical protein